MTPIIRFSFFLFFSIFSSFAFSADYLWHITTSTSPGFKTWQEACYERGKGISGGPYPVIGSNARWDTATTKYCVWGGVSGYSQGYSQTHLTVKRFGDSCPNNGTWNNSTGTCDPDKCEATAGKKINHQHTRGLIGTPATEPPISICKNSCQYTFTFAVNDVFRFVNPTPQQLDMTYGNYVYQGNGTACTNGNPAPGNIFDQPPSLPPMDKTPEYNQDNKCDDWKTNPDGTLTRSCTSTEEFKQPGTLDCVGLTAAHCKPGNPSPEYTKTDVTSETKQTTNPDGSKQTDTITTTDKTICKGAKPCTNTNKTETETTGTDAQGKEGDKETTCKGTGCTPSKDKTEKDDTEEEEKEEERTAITGSCDAPVTCSGDAIDCAVLQEQKSQRCLIEDAGDFPKHKSDVDSLLTDEKYQLETETVQVPGLLEGSTRFLPSSCPAPKHVSLSGGKSVSIDFDLFCRFASGIAPVIVALALLFGALYVGRSFGGG